MPWLVAAVVAVVLIVVVVHVLQSSGDRAKRCADEIAKGLPQTDCQ